MLLKCPSPLIVFFSHQKIYLFPISLVKKLQLYVFSSIFCEFLKFWKYGPLWFTAEFEGEWVKFGLWRQRGNRSAWLCTETSKKVVQNMPDRCVAASCSNVADPSKGIFVHTIPFFGDSRPEAIKRRKKWVDFVKAKRAKWEPTKHSAVYSVHFKPDDYVFQYVLVPTLGKPSVPRLKRDKIGIVVFPTVHAIDVDTSLPLSERSKRKVRRFISAIRMKLA